MRELVPTASFRLPQILLLSARNRSRLGSLKCPQRLGTKPAAATMSTAVKTSAVPFSRKWHWPLEELFRDLRVRYGVKMGLAGILALYVAQAIRLPHDNWAILSVLVMMTGQYVGSIAVKAILRVIGQSGILRQQAIVGLDVDCT